MNQAFEYFGRGDIILGRIACEIYGPESPLLNTLGVSIRLRYPLARLGKELDYLLQTSFGLE